MLSTNYLKPTGRNVGGTQHGWMTVPVSPDPALFLTRDLDAVMLASPAIRRGLRGSAVARIRRGAYIDASEWATLDAAGRYRALIRATALEAIDPPVLSHYSAAVFWGLPTIGSWPSDVHMLVKRASGGRSDPGIRRHALGIADEDVTAIDGLRVTTLARTVVDLAATAPLYSAVAAVDAALHQARRGAPARVTRAELIAQWERMTPFRSWVRARKIIDFAVMNSGSTSESTSRASIALLGFPAPILQKDFIVDGKQSFVDFYWEECDGIGECDGFAKYTDPIILAGRTTDQAVLEEKDRENSLRRLVAGFQRWNSSEAMRPAWLRVKLLELGLQQGSARLRKV